jgi:hypothetical protein
MLLSSFKLLILNILIALGNCCSIHLSYGATFRINDLRDARNSSARLWIARTLNSFIRRLPAKWQGEVAEIALFIG